MSVKMFMQGLLKVWPLWLALGGCLIRTSLVEAVENKWEERK